MKEFELLILRNIVMVKVRNPNALVEAVIDNALKYVVFDGWSEKTLKKVCSKLQLDEINIRKIFPRGGVDLALAFHKRDDERFLLQFTEFNASRPKQRIRDRIELAINTRLDLADQNKEAVKRSLSLLTTPLYLHEGTRALWNTSDKIWTAVGDESKDLNWYSKRLILSSVYSSVLIFWLEDDSKNFSETKGFIKRRINDVMKIEKFKVNIKKSPLWNEFLRKFEVAAVDIIKHKEGFPGW